MKGKFLFLISLILILSFFGNLAYADWGSARIGWVAFTCMYAPSQCPEVGEGEADVVSLLKKYGWDVNSKMYSSWTDAELDNYDLMVCGGYSQGCKNIALYKATYPNVYNEHILQGKPLIVFGGRLGTSEMFYLPMDLNYVTTDSSSTRFKNKHYQQGNTIFTGISDPFYTSSATYPEWGYIPNTSFDANVQVLASIDYDDNSYISMWRRPTSGTKGRFAQFNLHYYYFPNNGYGWSSDFNTIAERLINWVQCEKTACAIDSLEVVYPNNGDDVTGTSNIDFNWADDGATDMNADIYFSSTAEGKENIIMGDLNLMDSANCTDADSDTATDQNCSYSWNPDQNVGYYYIDIEITDGTYIKLDSSDNASMVNQDLNSYVFIANPEDTNKVYADGGFAGSTDNTDYNFTVRTEIMKAGVDVNRVWLRLAPSTPDLIYEWEKDTNNFTEIKDLSNRIDFNATRCKVIQTDENTYDINFNLTFHWTFGDTTDSDADVISMSTNDNNSYDLANDLYSAQYLNMTLVYDSITKIMYARESASGAGVKIVVSDTRRGAALGDINAVVKDCNCLDAQGGCTGSYPCINETEEHATKVIGLIAGHGKLNPYNKFFYEGIAPDANIYQGVIGTYMEVGEAMDILDWAISIGADIVNESWILHDTTNENLLYAKYEEARDANITIVKSAGNQAYFETDEPKQEAVLAVGDRIYDYGADSDNGELDVTTYTPNYTTENDIVTTNFGGTSSAAVWVSGVLALMIELHPTWLPYQRRLALTRTAVDDGNAWYDSKYGWGYVDANVAIHYRDNNIAGTLLSDRETSPTYAIAPVLPNDTYTITWTSFDINSEIDFNLFYSTTKGGTSNAIATKLASTTYCNDTNGYCTYPWVIPASLQSDTNYYIRVESNSLSSAYANSYYPLQLSNTAPDANITKIDGYLDNQPLPPFSYYRDLNLTIDFNVLDAEDDRLTVDLNYSSSNVQGTGTVIIDDLNLDSTICDDNTFTNSTYCSWDFNIHSSLISDGNYFILIEVDDNIGTDFNASDNNFMVDNTAPITTTDYNKGVWQNVDKNVVLSCIDVGSGCITQYRKDSDASSGVSMGSWQAYDTDILVNTDGNYRVDFNSTDRAGNKEFDASDTDTNNIYILVDKTAPTVASYVPAIFTTTSDLIPTFTATLIEPYSGLKECFYEVFKNDASAASGKVTASGLSCNYTLATSLELTQDQNALVQWIAKDNADNNCTDFNTALFTFKGASSGIIVGVGGEGVIPAVPKPDLNVADVNALAEDQNVLVPLLEEFFKLFFSGIDGIRQFLKSSSPLPLPLGIVMPIVGLVVTAYFLNKKREAWAYPIMLFSVMLFAWVWLIDLIDLGNLKTLLQSTGKLPLPLGVILPVIGLVAAAYLFNKGLKKWGYSVLAVSLVFFVWVWVDFTQILGALG